MSIFKETFKDFVFKQLRIREAIVEQGNAIKDPTNFSSRFGSPRLEIPSAEDREEGDEFTTVNMAAGAFYTNSVSKQCVIRMSSGVDIIDDNLFEKTGSDLAERYILEGGILKNPTGQGGNTPTLRSGGIGRGGAYGSSYIRSDAKDGFGIVPMPGIIDANIRTKTAYGSLREAKVNFVCHNRRQLDVLEMLYMRPGFPILLEWQWSPFINNDGKIDNNPYGVKDDWWDKNKTINEFNLKVIDQKELSGGNYDGFVGFCKNFEIKARPDGGYDCTTELIAAGEVLEGLKARNNGGTYKKGTKVIPADNFELMLRRIKEISQLRYLNRNNVTHSDKYSNSLLEVCFIWRSDKLGIKERWLINDSPILSKNTYVRWDMLCNLINDTTFPIANPDDPDSPLLKLIFTQSKNGKYDKNPNKLPKSKKNYRLINEEYIKFAPYKLKKHPHLFEVRHTEDSKIITIETEDVLNNSFNPSVCLLPQQNNKLQYFKTYNKEKIGHIMLNVDHLLEVYRQMAYSGDKPAKDFNLFDYFNRIWSDVNKACAGHHNFMLQTELERPDKVRVIDFQTDKMNDLDNGLFEFKIQSNKSIVRDFNYNTTIPSSLSATIAIAAQAPTSVSDLDQVTFSNFSKGIKSRFTSNVAIVELDEEEATESEFDKYKKDLMKYQKMILALDKYLEKVYLGDQKEKVKLDGEVLGEATSLALSIESLLPTLLSRNPVTGEKIKTPPASRSAVIPLKFNAKMDGIGGIVIGHVFKVEKDKLPKGYQADDVAFVVMGESQNITSGQDWSTEISGQLMLLDLGLESEDYGDVNTELTLYTPPPTKTIYESIEDAGDPGNQLKIGKDNLHGVGTPKY